MDVEQSAEQRAWESAEAEKRRAWETSEADKKRAIELWAKHEDIAMHFNDLTIRLRLQALGGVGAFSLVASSIFRHENHIDLKKIGPLLVAMFFVWSAIFALDQFYYHALLRAAVKTIIDLEKSIPNVDLSTKIKGELRDSRNARLVFYGIIGSLLLFGGAALWVFG